MRLDWWPNFQSTDFLFDPGRIVPVVLALVQVRDLSMMADMC